MKSISRKVPAVATISARIVLGLIFVVFGLNGLLHFLPQPAPPPAAGAFAGALIATGYFFPLLKITEIVAGSLLLLGVAVPLALTLLAPIIVNIVAFHLFLAPGNWGLLVVLLASELFLAWTYRAAFAPLFARRQPAESVQDPAALEPARRLAA